MLAILNLLTISFVCSLSMCIAALTKDTDNNDELLQKFAFFQSSPKNNKNGLRYFTNLEDLINGKENPNEMSDLELDKRSGAVRNPYSWMASRNRGKRELVPIQYSYFAEESNPESLAKFSNNPERSFIENKVNSIEEISSKRAFPIRNPYSWMNLKHN